MRLKELLSYIVDDVCIYKKVVDGEFKDLYQGKLSDTPELLLECSVGLIGANRKKLVDIEIRNIGEK